MLDVEVSPITSQQQNMDDRDSLALELHAITVVDWLERRMQCTRKQLLLYHLHTLNRVVYRCYKKTVTTHSIHERL